MVIQLAESNSQSRSMRWGEIILKKPKVYPSQLRETTRGWHAVKSIDVVTVCEDPKHWKSLAFRSMRGEKQAYSQLLEEFSICLELFFARILPDNLALLAVNDTLQSVAAKFHTCDAARPILPWLLAIAKYRADNPSSSARRS